MPLNVAKYVARARAHHRPQTQKSSPTNLMIFRQWVIEKDEYEHAQSAIITHSYVDYDLWLQERSECHLVWFGGRFMVIKTN